MADKDLERIAFDREVGFNMNVWPLARWKRCVAEAQEPSRPRLR